MFANKRNLSIFAIAILMLAAIAPMLLIAGPVAADGYDDNIIEDASIGMDWAYNTSSVDIPISYTLADEAVNFIHTNLTIVLDDGEDMIVLYEWTNSSGEDLDNPFVWSFNMLDVGMYTINVTARYWETIESMYMMDFEFFHFEVVDGTDIVQSVSTDVDEVTNSGMDTINVTIILNRDVETAIDNEISEVNFVHEETGTIITDEEWEPISESDLIVDNVSTVVLEYLIPLDAEVGSYWFYYNITDIWDYNEMGMIDLFDIIWRDMAPEMYMDEAMVLEDVETVIDLNDYFMDKNMDDLMFFVNDSMAENLTIEFDMMHSITVSAPENWTGTESIMVCVNDSMFNESFTLDITVENVNDLPYLAMEELSVYYNREKVFDLNEIVMDIDNETTDMMFMINDTKATNLTIGFDNTTNAITITPEENFTGTNMFDIWVSDGVMNETGNYTYTILTVSVNVMYMMFKVSGTVAFETVEGQNASLGNVTLTIGGMDVAINTTTGAYELMLDELGNYTVVMTITGETLYDAEAQSGYMVPENTYFILTADKMMDITIEWMEYVAPVENADFADLMFPAEFNEKDDGWEIIVNVKEASKNKTGFDLLAVQLVIVSDDEDVVFNLTWDATEMHYSVLLTEDQVNDLEEGKLDYTFKVGDESTETATFEFKEKGEDAGIVTVIVLIVLIILVLIALVFIMRKPSEDDFDEGEEEEEEAGERNCPGCGEVITDEEAEECPYCGEDLAEE